MGRIRKKGVCMLLNTTVSCMTQQMRDFYQIEGEGHESCCSCDIEDLFIRRLVDCLENIHFSGFVEDLNVAVNEEDANDVRQRSRERIHDVINEFDNDFGSEDFNSLDGGSSDFSSVQPSMGFEFGDNFDDHHVDNVPIRNVSNSNQVVFNRNIISNCNLNSDDFCSVRYGSSDSEFSRRNERYLVSRRPGVSLPRTSSDSSTDSEFNAAITRKYSHSRTFPTMNLDVSSSSSFSNGGSVGSPVHQTTLFDSSTVPDVCLECSIDNNTTAVSHANVSHSFSNFNGANEVGATRKRPFAVA